MLTTYILVFSLLTTADVHAMSAVAPFTTKEECNAHAAELFRGWSKLKESEDNHYHRMDSIIHYLELYDGEWAASWSCVPNISRELGLHNIPK
jgi:hypothetical protein|tara:strand:+ start:16 stop:294 length:279 start_codon:yes stop_codon:yes gene_type:complete